MINPTLQQVPVKIRSRNAKQNLTLTIVFHPDLQRIGQQCQPATSHIEISRLFPLFGRGLNDANPEPLADPFLSRTPITLRKKGHSWILSNEDSPIQLGTVHDQNIAQLHLNEQELNTGVPVILAGRIVLLCHLSQPLEAEIEDDMGLIGVSENLVRVRNLISKVAQLKAPVLIRGESGTGKELVAQAIHQLSQRNNKKLLSINMAAISKELVNAELFGSVKGAFTGAVSRNGCFREAHQSSLFLDEIGEAPIEVQIALLRALETGVIQPVGSNQEITLDVRFIAATDANLEALIGQESFRMPLLQRLSGLVIELEPLKQRREDIGCILSWFLNSALKDTRQLEKLYTRDQSQYCYWAWFFAECCEMNWPGNVRQVKNMVTQLSIALMSNAAVSHFDWHSFTHSIKKQHHIAEQAQTEYNGSADTESPSDHRDNHPEQKRKPREISDQEVLDALKKHHWQIKQAADELKISRAALYQKMDASPLIRRAGNIPLTELKSSFADCSGDLDRMVDKLQVSKQALKRRLFEIGLDS